MKQAFLAFTWVATVYVVGYYTVSLAMVLLAAIELRRQRACAVPGVTEALLHSGAMPGISVIVPAYNEEKGITRTIRSLAAARYPDLEIIVVNDGSKDGTIATLLVDWELLPSNKLPRASLPTAPIRAVYRSPLEPRLVVIDKRNGGKADALNAGIDFASRPLVCAIDADVLVDPDSLLHLARPFVEDPTTVATSGTIRLLNGCSVTETGRVVPGLQKSLLVLFQALEYSRAFTLGRLFFNPLNAQLIISGAFGLFQRSLLLELGGYQAYAIGEDMELVVRAQRHLRQVKRPFRIISIADAVLFTEAPTKVGELGRQRTRWHQGLLTSLRLHRDLFLNPRFGWVGLFAVPYFVLFELLSPFFELGGWLLLPVAWAFGMLSLSAVIPFFIAATTLSVLVSISALLVDSLAFDHFARIGDRLGLLLAAFLEPFGYHQLCLFFRLRAFPQHYGSIHIRTGWVPPARAQNPMGAR
jgi:cellulose synthase/poly-beta-1,6-N-acetylglucosamine synthase-like glycosyltransferase